MQYQQAIIQTCCFHLLFLCLSLILWISAKIRGLFGSGFGLTSKGFRLISVGGSIQPTRVDSLGLIF
jgi:hypothetical protein